MADKKNIIIIFDNYKEKEIEDVVEYGIDVYGYWYLKNGRKSFLNKEKVVFIGNSFDYREEK